MLSCSLSTLYTHYIAYTHIYIYIQFVVSRRSTRQIDGSAKLAHQITKHTMHARHYSGTNVTFYSAAWRDVCLQRLANNSIA